jgi:hypothetical protein
MQRGDKPRNANHGAMAPVVSHTPLALPFASCPSLSTFSRCATGFSPQKGWNRSPCFCLAGPSPVRPVPPVVLHPALFLPSGCDILATELFALIAATCWSLVAKRIDEILMRRLLTRTEQSWKQNRSTALRTRRLELVPGAALLHTPPVTVMQLQDVFYDQKLNRTKPQEYCLACRPQIMFI